jgi:hypothetical protein
MTAASVAADGLIGTSALRERGWTETAIKRFLGDADQLRPNPVYRSAAPARLYDSARVGEAEASPGWQEWRTGAAKRSARSSAAAETRRAALRAEIAALDIRVPLMDLDDLAERAVRHRNIRDADRAWDRGWDDPEPAEAGSVDQATLDRWCVNYLRHRQMSYDADLDALYGRVGRGEAEAAIRRRVYEVIAAAHPSLAAECARQQAEREKGY